MAMPAAAPGPKYNAALSAAYAASLRVNSAANLRTSAFRLPQRCRSARCGRRSSPIAAAPA